jgi:hypothetical protein
MPENLRRHITDIHIKFWRFGLPLEDVFWYTVFHKWIDCCRIETTFGVCFFILNAGKDRQVFVISIVTEVALRSKIFGMAIALSGNQNVA